MKGFFAWLRKIFGGSEEAAASTAAPPLPGKRTLTETLTIVQEVADELDADATAPEVRHFCDSLREGRRNGAAFQAKRLSRLAPGSGPALRHLEVAFESLLIINRTKNTATLASRYQIALGSLADAHSASPRVFGKAQLSDLQTEFQVSASKRLYELAIERLQTMQLRTSGAKTEKSRIRLRALASQLVDDMAASPLLVEADRLRLQRALIDQGSPPEAPLASATSPTQEST